MRLVKLAYKTKDKNELISYWIKGHTIMLPMIYVYEHTGTEKEAMEDFLPLGSFAFAKTGDSYIAFPMKGASKVLKGSVKLLYRIENGRITPLENICKLCKDRLKRALEGCGECDSLRKVQQLMPMKVIDVEGYTEEIDHGKKKRRKR